LAVDEDRLPLSVWVLLGAGNEVCKTLRQALAPQIIGFEEVRVA
jgi:hypothetical protein